MIRMRLGFKYGEYKRNCLWPCHDFAGYRQRLIYLPIAIFLVINGHANGVWRCCVKTGCIKLGQDLSLFSYLLI